jgi:sugar O-acyltransferase (sialic acid O-acetyltransferase NeuD family)
MKVAIIGWHEGTAGITDSWLNQIGIEVCVFISLSNDHEKVDSNSHIRFGNKKFSYPNANGFKNKPIVIDPEWYLNISKYSVDSFLITESDILVRSEQLKLAQLHGVRLLSAIHPSVLILDEAEIGSNCIIQAGTIIGYKSVIGDGVFINSGCIIEHHALIENNVTIDPGCTIAGNVRVKSGAVLHTGTVVINKIIIGSNSIVGAGSVVTKDVPNNAKVVGVPARAISTKNNFKS